jgi:hypothetical protein
MDGTSKAPQLAFGVGRDELLLPVVATQDEEGFQVVLHGPVERGVGEAAGLVGGGDASLGRLLQNTSHVHRLGDESDDPHLGPALGAGQGNAS